MTVPGAARPRRGVPAAGVIEADYLVVEPGRPERAAPPDAASPGPAASAGGMEMLRGSAPPARERMPGGPLFWGAGIAVALAAFWVSGGHALVRHSPLFSPAQAAKAAFSVTAISSRFDVSGPHPVLLVDGEAANEGSESGILPPLEIRVAAPGGATTRYRLGTSGRMLGPGQSLAFSSRLDVPKNGVGAVSVAFTE